MPGSVREQTQSATPQNMPSAAARRVYEDQIPSFMSVFDLDAETMADRDTITVVDPRMVDVDAKQATMNVSQPLGHGVSTDPNHKHNDSTSTQMSESADSSPTTTLSITDSSPLSDPSPSSSPDSPVGLVPLNDFPATSFGSHVTTLKPAPAPTPVENLPQTSALQRPMTSPAPRKRNMKGLSIQPPSIAPAASSAVISEPASPVFIKPKISGMKRKPSMLSLKTNTSDLVGKPIAEVPPSPGMGSFMQRRALKHSISSPHMLSTIKSATFGPAGGMTLPNMLERNESGLSEVLRPMKTSMKMNFDTTITEESPTHIRSQMASRMDAEPFHEKVNNEDQKTPGYPGGPIAIYDDDVYLYLEPTAEEASRFDLVINVASEVVNPFDAEKKTKEQSSTIESPTPDTALTNASFATAFEFQPGAETPTTPKANPFRIPEYIHMPWDHSTDIAPDLMKLCETIDNRTKAGKKVLIHCQQGASRSASLIIAYGLYKRPDLSVNDAYYAAQAKSRWISPNMKLMYCLQDFQKNISKRRLPQTSTYRSGRSPTKHRLTLSADAVGLPMKEPRTAPLPGEENEERADGHLRPTENHRRGNSMPSPQEISPGPQSAPPNYSWREEVEKATDELPPPPPQMAELPQRPKVESVLTQAPEIPRQNMSYEPPPTPGFNGPAGGLAFHNKGFPRFSNHARLSQHHIQFEPPVAFAPPTRAPPPPPPQSAAVDQTVSIGPAYPDDAEMLSPRVEAMTKNPLHDFSSVSGMHFQETPPTPDQNLFSPRQTMFPRDPMAPFGRPDQVADPRSPPTVGETPIVRSIDDIL